MVGASSRLLSLLTNPTYLLRHRPFALFRLACRRSLTFPLTTLSAAAGDHRVHLSRHNSVIPIKLAQSFYSRATYNALQENNQIPANDYHAPPSHPWLEWTRLLESLSVEGYFNGRSNIEDEFTANENLSMEFVAAANSCLAFARDRPDILGWLPRKDIEVLIDDGYPFLFKNAHEIERRMRSFLQVEGSNEASSVDLMKYILSYASNPIIYPERNIKEATESSVRTLLQEMTNLSYTGQYSKQFQAVGRDEQMPRNLGPNITMKKGDWICPKCNFMNFARNTKCLECEELRPQSQLTGGEWDCPRCNFINYRTNVVCLKCECNRPGHAKTPYERQHIGSHYRNNYDDNGIPNGGNNFRVRNNIDRGQNDRKDGYVPFVPLPADMFAKKPEKIADERSEERCFEKSTTYVQSRHISDADKEEKSERWFQKVKELHGVTGPTNDFPQIMPTRNVESRFVDSMKKDRPFTPYRKQHAMEQGNTSSFVPFPPDYFAKKDSQQQPKNLDISYGHQQMNSGISSGHSQVNSGLSSGHSQVNSGLSSGHSQVNSGLSYGHSQVNSGTSYGHSQVNSGTSYGHSQVNSGTSSAHSQVNSGTSSAHSQVNSGFSSGYSQGNQHMSSTNKVDSNTHSSNNQFKTKETINMGQKAPENPSGWTGKSLEGSAVTEPDPLDMSEEAKAERWFRRVAQIKDISELSQIPDEDFPSIMPMRKGVNRFVVSKRKTPLERRLTSPQYRKNLRIMSSDPMKREGDDDN